MNNFSIVDAVNSAAARAFTVSAVLITSLHPILLARGQKLLEQHQYFLVVLPE